MAWIKLQANFPTNPKVVEAGVEASGLYVQSLCHCAEHLTDGHVSRSWAEHVMGSKRKLSRATDQLVSCGLWEENGRQGWTVHDYHQYQWSREQVEEKRTREAKRVAQHRLKGRRDGF